MGDEKPGTAASSSSSLSRAASFSASASSSKLFSPMAPRVADRGPDRELLMQNHGDDVEDQVKAGPQPPSAYTSGREAFYAVLQSWASKKFMSGCVILFPIAVTFYVTWWFIEFVDGFFKPVYTRLGFDIFGLGFVTTIVFIFLVGVFVSSWMGASVLWLGEWIIKRMPLVRHIYSASKQISAAISPDQSSRAFKEVAIIRHPRVGEYAFGFITSSLILQNENGDEELCSVYVPTNHLYIGDIFLINSRDIIRPNLSVREGIEIVVSGGMSMPQVISPIDMGPISKS
ncbi:hypothetical protein O6H91_05G073800 [Diphasiastrum complanatum]|uniref:Uncharacterized protein n=1 Tax=Diphasiastrum complanatum TaxID=34168 RepID=A0ACC2DPH5_DIPCM|nr:hypothetical protein O6H91_Y325200 [Diphasiastrum complanatum]KAJ7556197.1 hypothetical protein O6H91_05G073800 [Diphasiastrum complanatum]